MALIAIMIAIHLPCVSTDKIRLGENRAFNGSLYMALTRGIWGANSNFRR